MIWRLGWGNPLHVVGTLPGGQVSRFIEGPPLAWQESLGDSQPGSYTSNDDYRLLPGRKFAKLHLDRQLLASPIDPHLYCIAGVLAQQRVR
jgi:hypothetical protein